MTSTDRSHCFSCGKPLGLPEGPVSRGATCDSCGSDVRVCSNCIHFDPQSYNECREPMSDRVVDKTRSNYCDYFSLRRGEVSAQGSKKSDILKSLDDLFKK